MKKLVVMRHGSYFKDGDDETAKLADVLVELIGKESILLFSSVKLTRDARIVAEKLGVPFEEYELLWSETEHPADFPGTLKLVKSCREKVDVIVIVTHVEYATSFPKYYLEKELGAEIDDFFPPTKTGHALVLDCEKKTITSIP